MTTRSRNALGQFVSEDVVKQNGSGLTAELGVPTGKRWTSFHDDYLPDLRGKRAIKWYREMQDSDDVIGSILFAIEMQIRAIEWNVEPGGETPQDEEAAAFLESCRDDMSVAWPDFVASALTFLPYGWSFHEIVYKLRDGVNSRFDDGLIGWRKFAYQPQEALWDFELDEHGGIEAFKWSAAGEKGEIPIEKGLLFRTTTSRGPTGRSVLRNAFRAYQFKKRLEEYAAIGVERDLNGLPVMKVPVEIIEENSTQYERYKDFVTRIRKDELWGAVIPLARDEEGNEMYEFDVISSNAGESIGATRELISYFATNIAAVVLADFIRLGRDAVGSRALADPKQQLFQQALQGWVTAMAEVLNRHAVPRLFQLNDLGVEVLPRFAPEPVEDVALEDLGRFIQSTAQAGMDWGFLDEDDRLTDQVRQLAGFDARPDAISKNRKLDFDVETQKWRLR